jgi:hypothetical protein
VKSAFCTVAFFFSPRRDIERAVFQAFLMTFGLVHLLLKLIRHKDKVK